MAEIQTQGVHHITFVGSNREEIIAFYSGVLGMPLVLDQPNLDVPEEEHLYFDPGDGRLITFFVRPSRTLDPAPNPQGIGNLHHLAFNVSRAVYTQVAKRLNERGIHNTGPRISCRTARLKRNTASLASRSGINSSSNSATCASAVARG